MISRRTFIQGMLAVPAVIALPSDEEVKRFWRGWSAGPGSKSPQNELLVVNMNDVIFQRDTILQVRSNFDICRYDVMKIDDEIVWFDGENFVRGVAGTTVSPHSAHSLVQVLGSAYLRPEDSPPPHIFRDFAPKRVVVNRRSL